MSLFPERVVLINMQHLNYCMTLLLVAHYISFGLTVTCPSVLGGMGNLTFLVVIYESLIQMVYVIGGFLLQVLASTVTASVMCLFEVNDMHQLIYMRMALLFPRKST
jgi:hypothetical protein